MLSHAVANAPDSREHPHLLVQALHLQGQCLREQGRLVEAGAMLAAAEDAFSAQGDTSAAACCRRDRAVVVYFQGDYPVAETLFASALHTLDAADAAVDAFWCLCWMCFMAVFRQRIPEATAALERARSLVTATNDPCPTVVLRLCEGMLEQRLVHADAAHALLADATARFEASGDDIWLGRALTQHGLLWFDQQDLDRASACCERALAILERSGSRHYAAMTREVLGKIATDANRWDDAYRWLAEARAVYDAEQMQMLAAQAGLHRANVDYWLDAWLDAEEGYRTMARTARRYGSLPHVITSESNLGLLALNRGRLDEALMHTHASLDYALAFGRSDDMARCHRQLGNVYGTLRRWEQTAHHFEAALALLQQVGQPLYRAQTQTEYAEYLRAKGAYDPARRLLDEARTVLAHYGAPLYAAECDIRRARLALDQGDPDAAERYAHASSAVYTRLESLNELARLHTIYGGIARMRGDRDAARREYERAYTLLARSFPDEAVEAATHLATLCGEDREAALAWYRRAITVSREARSLVPTEPLAAELARQAALVLCSALHLALDLGQPQTALTLAEDARAQVALAWLEGQRRSRLADAGERDLATRCTALRSAIATLEQHAALTSEQHERLAVLRAEYDDALAIRRRFGSNLIPGNVQPFGWESCRARLDRLGVPWNALVYWMHGDDLWTWWCHPDGITATARRLTPAERRSLELCCDPSAARRSFVYDRDPSLLWSASPVAAHLRRVANVLLPPSVRGRLTPDGLLVVVPAGMLHGLPFAALPLDDMPLITHTALAIAPSLQLLERLLERDMATGERALAIGISRQRERAALPAACAEARMVAAHTRGDVWCDEDATAARLRTTSEAGTLAHYHTIHIASHAWMGVAGGTEAGIAFADEDIGVADLAHLRLDANLVVLSACESGVAIHHTGEEMVGLTYALLQAGSRAFVASLWKMEDARSSQFMRRMYAAFHEGERGPWALAQAQRAAHRAGETPFHWAGYVWHGHPNIGHGIRWHRNATASHGSVAGIDARVPLPARRRSA